jgi:hypothetical protein
LERPIDASSRMTETRRCLPAAGFAFEGFIAD